MTGHQFIPTTHPHLRDDPDPTLLDRAVARVGADFPSVGTFVYAGLVGGA